GRAPFGLSLLLAGRPPGDAATPAKPGESCEKRESQPGDEQKCRRGANLGAVEDRGRGERDSREDAEVAERLHQHAAETQAGQVLVFVGGAFDDDEEDIEIGPSDAKTSGDQAQGEKAAADEGNGEWKAEARRADAL